MEELEPLPDIAEIRFDDPEDFTQGERLRSLLHSRSECMQARRDATQARIDPMYTERQGLIMYRNAIENYILDLWPLSLENDIECVDRYWYEIELGEIVISPGVEQVDDRIHGECLRKETNSRVPSVYKSVEPGPQQFTVKGLESILELPEEIGAQFQYERLDTGETGTFTESKILDMSILDRAFRAADGFRREVGLDVDVGGQEDGHGGPY